MSRSKITAHAAAAILPALSALLVVLVLAHAWVAEDAFITFRVVDNLVEGRGLRWNVDERVQVYTHPLWMLLHLPVRVISANLFLGTIVVGLALTVILLLVLLRGSSGGGLNKALLLVVPLVLSKSFIEFSTSGLETSLSHVLFAVFFVVLFLTGSSAASRFPWLVFVAALAGVNRLDTLLIFLPVLSWILWRHRREIPVARSLLALLPLVLWEVFSVLYYGFPVPNTAYAKLGAGLDRVLYWKQGLFYLLDYARRDLSSFVLMLAGIGAAPLVLLFRPRSPSREMTYAAAVGAGVFFYVIYVISVGGDFMSGRFWTLPFLAGLTALYAAFFRHVSARSAALLAGGLIVLEGVTLVSEPPERMYGDRHGRVWKQITDERLWYAEGHALYTLKRPKRLRFSMPVHNPRPPEVIYWWAVGYKAYEAGPEALVIDGLALTDALLARLPAQKDQPFHVGHIKRAIPPGYMEARAYGVTELMQPDLKAYYDQLRLVTSGPLWSAERFRTIVDLNLGRYDDFLKKYLDSDPPLHPYQPNDRFFRMTPDEYRLMRRRIDVKREGARAAPEVRADESGGGS